MKKTMTAILSVVLVITMLFSSVVSASAAINAEKLTADPAVAITQGNVTNSGNANPINATLLMDFLDDFLANMEKQIKFDVSFGLIQIHIDLTSVNGILKTVDTLKNNSGVLKWMGSLKNLNVKNWSTGQTRAKTGDFAILKNLLQFVSDNGEIVKLVLEGNFSAGDTIDKMIERLAGFKMSEIMKSVTHEDSIYIYIKKMVAGFIYDKNSEKAKFDATVKKTLDEIIFVDLLTVGLNKQLAKWDAQIKEANAGKEGGAADVLNFLYGKGFKLEGALNGFSYDKNKSIDALIADIASVLYNNNQKYIYDLVAEYGDDLDAFIAGSEYGAPFAKLLKFENAVGSVAELNFTNSKNSVKGLNDFFKFAVSKLIKSYTGWKDSANLGKNIQDLLIWAIQNRDTSVANDPYAGVTGTDFASYAMSFAKMLVKLFVTDADAVAKMNSCKTTQDVMTILLPYLMNKGDATIVSAKANTWEKVLGDIIGYYLNPLMPLYTDAKNTKRYQVGSATAWTDVVNYAANYYLVDLNLDTIFGLDLNKSQTIYQKLDALQGKLFTGVKSMQYVAASKMIPALIKDVFDLSLDGAVKEFEGAFTDINTNVSAANLLYNLINNALNAVFGKAIFPANFTSLDYIIQDANISAAAKNILEGLNARKDDIIPVALYWFTTLSSVYQFSVAIGNNAAVTVKFGGTKEYLNDDGSVKRTKAFNKNLTSGTDFTVKAVASGKKNVANVTVSGKGNYVGTVAGTSKCTSHTYGAAKCTTKATTKKAGVNTYTCTRCGATKTEAIAYAKTVTLKYTSTTYTGKALKPAVTVKDSAGKVIAASNYTVKYAKNTNVGTATVTVTFKGNYSGTISKTFKIVPKQVTGLKASKVAATSIELTWSKVTGAKYYKVEQSTDGKKWKTVATVTATKATVKSLKAGTAYQFRVTAGTDKKMTIAGKASAVAKLSSLTAAPTGVTVKNSKTKQATVSWKKVTGAKSYEVYKSTDGKKWTKAATSTKTSVTLKKLTKGKPLYIKVRALNAQKKAGAYSSVAKIAKLK